MMVETAIAALAMLLWVLVEPGFLRSLAYNVMFAASVTTVLFNGNPLMRYDGYYILSDLVEIPNLGQRATRFWTGLVNRHLFANPAAKADDATLFERALFLFYAPASTAYRLTVTIGIAFFLAEKYWAVGVALALWSVASTVVLPLFKAGRYVVTSPSLQRRRTPALAVTFGGLAVVGLAALLVPAPLHTTIEGVVWLPDSAIVRAGTDGFVAELLARPGEGVPQAEPIVRLEEPSLLARQAGLQARVAELRAQLQAQQFEKLVDAEVTRTELAMAEADLAETNRRVGLLVVRSAAAGQVTVPQPLDLPGRFVRQGELIGYVLPPEGSRVVRAVVLQEDVELVRNHLAGIELQVAGYPDAVLTSRVVREVPGGRDTLSSKALGSAGGGVIAVDPRDSKGTRTLHRTFEVDIDLPAGAPVDSFGARVHVRLNHDWEPLADQLYRRVRQLLLSRLQA